MKMSIELFGGKIKFINVGAVSKLTFKGEFIVSRVHTNFSARFFGKQIIVR